MEAMDQKDLMDGKDLRGRNNPALVVLVLLTVLDVAPLELKICFGDRCYKYAGPLDLVGGGLANEESIYTPERGRLCHFGDATEKIRRETFSSARAISFSHGPVAFTTGRFLGFDRHFAV